jgi:hypothetical protein
MISHCANPDCRLPFHYLRGGRLYRFDIRHPTTPCSDVPNAICSLKPSQGTVFFWLCEKCFSKYSLRFNFRDGISLVSLTDPVRKHNTAPVIAVGGPIPDGQDDRSTGGLP